MTVVRRAVRPDRILTPTGHLLYTNGTPTYQLIVQSAVESLSPSHDTPEHLDMEWRAWVDGETHGPVWQPDQPLPEGTYMLELAVTDNNDDEEPQAGAP